MREGQPASARPRLSDRVWTALFSPVDISFLVFVRVAFGAIMLWEVERYFRHGWIQRFYMDPVVTFPYFGFDWLKPLPGDGMLILFAGLGMLAACILLGLFYRVAAALFFVGFTYFFLLDEVRYLNHMYLIGLLSFLLIFLPANRLWSLDVLRNPGLRSDTAPGWTLWLLRAQVGLVYFFGGVAKLNHDWLHGEPMRAWLARRADYAVVGPLFLQEWAVWFFVIGGLVFDLAIFPLLLWRRTRLPAFLAAALFHVMNSRLFEIGIFPWFMLCATLVFFPPDLTRRVVNAVTGAAARARRPRPETARTPGFATMHERVLVAALGAWVLVQVLLPLRHWLYPGDVSWTEEGHRFAWHMKLRDKEARAIFFVTDPQSGRVWTVQPKQHLSGRQRDRMASHPDMVLQYAHFLEAEKRREGFPDVEVRARVLASLNGRMPQLLVDSTVDLTLRRRSLAAANWITPLTVDLPRTKPEERTRLVERAFEEGLEAGVVREASAQ